MFSINFRRFQDRWKVIQYVKADSGGFRGVHGSIREFQGRLRGSQGLTEDFEGNFKRF